MGLRRLKAQNVNNHYIGTQNIEFYLYLLLSREDALRVR